MKKIIISGLILSSLLTFYSCNEDDFLHTEPTETVSTPTIEQKVNGIYTNMIRTGTGGTNLNHDDFGQKGYDIYMDLLSSDLALSRSIYGWYRSVANLTGPINYQNNNNYQPFRYYYRQIYASNDIINDLGGENAELTDEQKPLMGQAKALRAYHYFQLMQLFTKEYNPSADGVPLVTTIDQPTYPMVPQSEVYALIESDLLEAESLLEGFNRSQKAKVDQDVARGMLAYVYAAMHNYNKVVEYAGKVVNESGYPLTSAVQLTGGFNDANTPSWMWGIDITTDQGLDLVSWWGQMDMYTYSYQYVGDYKTIDDNIRLNIREDDVRKNQFVDYQAAGATYWMPMNKFYHADKNLGGQRNIDADYIYMRADEFYLLLAEGYAKLGNDAQAKATLKQLLAERISDLSYIDALSGNSLLEEIYFQTRLELFGEGKSYYSFKRNKINVTRGANHVYLPGQVLNYDTDGVTLLLPEQEVINNPNL